VRQLPPRMQPQLYHDLIFHEETLVIREKAREFVVRELAPLAYEIAHKEEHKDNFPKAIFHKLVKEDFSRIPFAKDVGGLGLKYPACATAVVVEELAYMSNSVASTYDAYFILASHALMYGSDLIKQKYLRPLIAGKKLVCFATSEPTGSTELSLRTLRTFGKRQGNKYIINGQKRFITGACVADFVVALINTDGRLSMIVIDLRTKGCRVGDPDKKLGNKGQLTSDIYFHDVEIPFENLIGEEGGGLRIALESLTYGRVGIGASGVGMAQSAFDESVAHMKRREVFGKRIAQFQYWQFRLAERAIQIENSRNLYSKAAMRMDQGIAFPEPEASGAKYYATECAVNMARDAVQIFGGYGFMETLEHDKSTYKVEEIYRDSKIAEIYEGTNEIQKLIIAREIFGKEMTG